MNVRLLSTVALFLIAVVGLAIHQIGRETPGGGVASEFTNVGSAAVFVQESPTVGELTLVRTPDSEFLNDTSVNFPSEPVAPEDTAEQGGEAAEAVAGIVASADGASVGLEGDRKEIKELGIAAADGKEFKEIIDPKGLPPIADGSESGGGGGGGIGGGGGGGGGAIPGEVMAFEEVIEVEKDGNTITQNGPTTVVERTIIRTVPQAAPVPEPGSTLTGFAVAAISFAAMFRRARAA